jgi:6-phosphogluconolactonase
MFRKYLLLISAILMSASHSSTAAPTTGQDYLVYVGVYGKGVYAYRFSSHTGNLDSLGLVGDITNPSFVATDPDFRYLYAVSELQGKENGGVAAFSIDRETGKLTHLNSASSDGQAPCHLAVDHTKKLLTVANYGTGSVAVFPLEADGKLGPMSGLMTAEGSSVNPERQKGPHAHETVISPDNRFVYVPDLGLDQIRIYRVDTNAAKLLLNDPPHVKVQPGFGPRHIVFSSNGRYAYVVNELKSAVTVFTRDPNTGSLNEVQTASTVPPNFKEQNAPAEVLMGHDGKYLYASNRGPGTIAVFSINPESGALTQIQIAPTGGTFPRGVEIDPTGRFMLAGDQKADQFVVFQIDPNTGKLTLTGKVYNVPSPVAFLFVPTK